MFEINAKSIEILARLQDINVQKDKNIRLVIEDLKQKDSEYRSEGKDILIN